MKNNPLLEASPLDADDGELIGRDPAKITEEEWREAGTEYCVGLSAIRAKCIDCCAGSFGEIRKCVVTDCALWPFRLRAVPKNYRKLAPEVKKNV